MVVLLIAADLVDSTRDLASLPGVLGVGFGLKERRGVLTGVSAWRVYVRTKRPADGLSSTELVPSTVDGFATDVVEKLVTRPTAGASLAAPASGARIANSRGVPGTLGCLAVTLHDGRPVLLTNHHVLFGGGAPESEPVWLVDGVEAAPSFRELGCSLYGKRGVVAFGGVRHHVDCAVGSIDGAGGLGRRSRLRPEQVTEAAAPGDRVTKTGGATGTTAGIVVDVAYPDMAFVEGRAQQAPQQILVRPAGEGPFSADGDSGAILRNGSGGAVGLVWGMNHRGESVACHIGPVLEVLNIRAVRSA
jgi:endonuclease G